MPRFEYIGGGSDKFWDIDRAGASVTVRFGRIGTAGQTQVKDLGTDQAAGAHVAKLVAEKVKKGYVEGSAPAPAPRPEVGTVLPAAEESEADEDRWEVPNAWWRYAEPFRGRSPAHVVKLDPAAVEAARKLAFRTRAMDAVLDHPDSDPELVRLARRYLDITGSEVRR